MNPFVFSGASNLTDEQILTLFIHDYNYSRFIESKRNFFFWGERGSGKTMTLLYNKLVIQRKARQAISEEQPVEFIPVYVSCITPLVFKREFLLLKDDFKASVVSEHYLSLSIGLAIVDALLEISELCNAIDQNELRLEFEYLLDHELQDDTSALKGIKSFFRKEFIKTQREINDPKSDSFYRETYTFSSLVMPLIEILSNLQPLIDTHFIIMVDDAHDLNESQREMLNSWIAYRDNSSFSFKVSAAKMSGYSFVTSSGGSILQGHDYAAVNMEQAFQNNESGFSKMAQKIISKRLEFIGFSESYNPELFFPESETVKNQVEECKNIARQKAIEIYGANEAKKISDYAYKYGRAIFFRDRSSKANRPQYSGLETIINLSSGVIRNLLEPCFVMYEDMLSEVGAPDKVKYIKPNIQADVIARLSNTYWERLRHGIDKEQPECSHSQAEQLANFFEALAKLFRDRLLDTNCSEPRAIAFTISAQKAELMSELQPILNLAQRSQLLYVRSGTAKDGGAKEDYYVPNKMLWPARGLDPIGQHARVSIQAKKLVDALKTKNILYKHKKQNSSLSDQMGDLFDE